MVYILDYHEENVDFWQACEITQKIHLDLVFIVIFVCTSKWIRRSKILSGLNLNMV